MSSSACYFFAMGKTVSVGLIQMHCGMDPEKNFSNAARRVRALARRGAQIICLPELFLTEYFCQTKNKKFFKYAKPMPWLIKNALGKMAKENKVVIITSVYERAGKKFFNTAVVIGEDGRLKGKYRKMHIPDDLKNHYGEQFYFEKGNLGFRAIKTRFVCAGPMICWDQWFPEGARACAAKGAQILFYPTAIGFPASSAGHSRAVSEAEHEAWQIIQRSHAIANNVFVVAVNRVGRDNHLDFWGSSFACDPYGRVLAQAPVDKETDLLVKCDLSLIKQMRADWPFLASRRIKF